MSIVGLPFTSRTPKIKLSHHHKVTLKLFVLSIQDSSVPKVTIRLREAMDSYAQRTGEKMTYPILAERTGLARATLESIATRANYNATLHVLVALCEALDCNLQDLVELHRHPTRHRSSS